MFFRQQRLSLGFRVFLYSGYLVACVLLSGCAVIWTADDATQTLTFTQRSSAPDKEAHEIGTVLRLEMHIQSSSTCLGLPQLH